MASAIDLTTLAAVRLYGNIPASVTDAQLGALITAASSRFLTDTRRGNDFQAAQSTSELRDGLGTDSLMLWNYPVVSLDSLLIFGIAVPAATSANPVGWFCDLPSGLVRLGGGGWPNPAFTGGWGSFGRFPRAAGAVVINYHYGYSAIPDDVAQCANEMVLFMLKQRDHIDKDSETLAGQSTKYKKSWPEIVQATIAYYTRKRRIP
jgi:hypothetical protein